MSKFRRILFPIDFSFDCQALLPTVRRMVECWDAQVTLLHVLDSRLSLGRRHDLQRLLMQKTVLAAHEISLDRICCRLDTGAPGDRIVEYARSRDIDLVALPAGGAPNLYGSPIGEVADQVLTEAPCAVWLDWGSARSRATAGMYARRVGCVLGLNESDEYILREAAALTAELEADLTLIHALRSEPGSFIRRHLEHLRLRLSPAAEVAIEVGPSRSAITRAIQRREAGLLVTGNWRETILAAEAECPVLRLVTPAAAAGHLEVPLRAEPAVLRKTA
jgi:nucleotide-binding universal stress UspA family protein